MNYPKVSIITLNWNGLDDTIECLESLKKITYPNYEVIVVDNGSEGNDAQVLKENYGDYVDIIQNDKNYYFAEGNNIALRYALKKAEVDYFVLLNNDTVVAPDFLSELVKVAESDESIGILGSKIYYYDKPNVIWSAGYKIHWWLGYLTGFGYREKDRGQCDELVERDSVSACAMLIRRGVLEGIGLLDSAFPFGAEDMDLCVRARREGFKTLYVPSARVWHKCARTTNRLVDSPESLRAVMRIAGTFGFKNRYRFFRKHSKIPPAIVPVFFNYAVILPMSALKYVILQRDLKYVLSEITRWTERIWRGSRNSINDKTKLL